MWSIQPCAGLKWLRCQPVTKSGRAPMSRKPAKHRSNYKPVSGWHRRTSNKAPTTTEWLTDVITSFLALHAARHPGWDARCEIIYFKAPDARQGKHACFEPSNRYCGLWQQCLWQALYVRMIFCKWKHLFLFIKAENTQVMLGLTLQTCVIYSLTFVCNGFYEILWNECTTNMM